MWNSSTVKNLSEIVFWAQHCQPSSQFQREKEQSLSERHASREKNSFLIPGSPLRFALKHGNKEPGPAANRVDLALLPSLLPGIRSSLAFLCIHFGMCLLAILNSWLRVSYTVLSLGENERCRNDLKTEHWCKDGSSRYKLISSHQTMWVKDEETKCKNMVVKVMTH